MKADNQITTERANWSFSGEVAKHFDDHVDKSVPGYHEGHEHQGEVQTSGTGGEAAAALMAVHAGNTTVRLLIRSLQADAG